MSSPWPSGTRHLQRRQFSSRTGSPNVASFQAGMGSSSSDISPGRNPIFTTSTSLRHIGQVGAALSLNHMSRHCRWHTCWHSSLKVSCCDKSSKQIKQRSASSSACRGLGVGGGLTAVVVCARGGERGDEPAKLAAILSVFLQLRQPFSHNWSLAPRGCLGSRLQSCVQIVTSPTP